MVVEFPRYAMTPNPVIAGGNQNNTSTTVTTTTAKTTTPGTSPVPVITDTSLVNPDLQGNTNPTTLDAENVANNPSQVALGPTQTSNTAPSLEDVRNGKGEIKPGDQGASVDRLTSIFIQLGLMVSGAPSRCYDTVMQAAVFQLQEENNLPKTGNIDQATMQAIDQRMTSLNPEDNELPPETQPAGMQPQVTPLTQTSPRPQDSN